MTDSVGSTTSADVVVLGGGPAGLAAAWRAARQGRSVVLVDRAATLGGMAASFEVAGVRVDHGSHRLDPGTPPEVLGDLRALLGDDLQTRPRNGRLRIAGRWVGFPLRAGQVARSLPAPFVRSLAKDALTGPLRRSDDSSYAAALRAGLGPTVYDAVYEPYAQKLWGLTGEQVDAEQARRRVTADTAWKVAARGLRGGRSASGAQRTFLYPRRGFGQVTEALADAADAAGARLLTGVEPVTVHARPDGVRVETSHGEIRAGHCLSTVPLPVLGRMARPAPPAQVVQDAAGLTLRAMVLVYLVHEGGRWTSYDAHHVPDPVTPVTRVSEPANYRVSDLDPTDRTVVCAEVPCALGDDLWTSSDEDLVRLVEEGLERVGLPAVARPAGPDGYAVRRLPRAYPVYAQGYAERLAGLDAWAERLANVTTFGRLGLFVHDNTHHAMQMAYDAVDSLRPDQRIDITAWQDARLRFAAHVVED